MTGRRRFLETMRYGSPDRVPWLEEGLRDEVLERWRAEGLPEGVEPSDFFHLDRRERVPVNLEPIPKLEHWPLSREGLRMLRERLDPDDPSRLPEDWDERVAAWRRREHILELALHSGFFLSMGVEGWSRFIDVMCLVADDPGLVREFMDVRAEFVARMAERVLREIEVDFVSFSEPIGGQNGPLLSPGQYRTCASDSYRPILDAVRPRGVETVCLVTYANARALMSAVVEAGFNCLWACEVDTQAMDYRDLRREFGRELRLIGGIDLDCLLAGEDAMRREIFEKAPPLLANGGYIPLADGRVRANIPFANYACYRRLLEEATRT